MVLTGKFIPWENELRNLHDVIDWHNRKEEEEGMKGGGGRVGDRWAIVLVKSYKVAI